MSDPVPSSPPAKTAEPAAASPEDVFVFPASFAQRRFWFVDRYNPGTSAYCLPILLRLSGPLDAALLERALNEILRRHEVLRTTFSFREGEVVQVIVPVARLRLSRVDLSLLPESDRESRALTEARSESQRPFDLGQGPLFRAHLWRLSEGDHLLLLDMHHIVADGWSFSVLLRELSILYQAFREGRPSPLPELSLQYADFAQWQTESVGGPDLEEDQSYWKTALAGAPLVLELRTDRPRPPRQTFDGDYVTELLPGGLATQIKALSRREGVTPFMTLLAAYFTLLYRHTGQTDLIVGSPIANRSRAELEPLIGLFMNTLVLRADLSGNPKFRDLLARIGRVCVDAYTHQDVPLEKVVEDLKPERDPSRNPVFQTMFVHQKAFIQPFVAGDVRFEPIKAERGGSLTDLSLFVIERDDGYTAGIEHNTDLFDGSTIRRMLGHLRMLLQAVVENAELRIDEIPILTPAERHQLLVEWNQTASDSPAKCLHRLFEDSVEKNPDAPAVRFYGEEISYRELNRRSNRLAHHLVRLGVGPDTRVAICLDRCTEAVVAIIAILKTGGAYVPLDPAYPRESLAFMLEDAEPSVVLTHSRYEAAIPFSGTVLFLDVLAGTLEGGEAGNPEGHVDPDDLAYLIYTSGSSGRPKGTMVPHRAVVNYLTWCVGAYSVASGRGAPVQSSLAFDLTVTSLFAPLLCGGIVELLPQRPAGTALADALALEQTNPWSLVKTTPAELELVTRQLTPENVRGRVRTLVIGGESLPAKTVSFWRTHSPETRIFNEYGPTETVVGCAVYEVGDGTLSGPVPIGRPIANTRLYVLGPENQPVPIGVAGELCIAGAGVATGYRGRPELTDERFVPDPFGRPGSRMYRSGDFARYLPDGNLEFLGRRDLQVKLRGYRIELEEIEASLTMHSAVRGCAVLAREDVSGEKRLVAYVEAVSGAELHEWGLRAFLKEKLPGHMVPSTFQLLTELPRTPNGKVDRRALPAPGLGSREIEARGVLPRDSLEAKLAAIWEEVLGVSGIGVFDDYFDMGGHSLLAALLFSRIGESLERHLPLATIFEAPTISQLARKLREEGWSPPDSSLVMIQRGVAGRAPLFCVPGVGGNIVGYVDLARELGVDQPVYGLQARGLDGKREPFTCVEDMARHYITEMLALFPNGPFLLAGASFGGRVAFEMARQLDQSGHGVALVALFDAFAPRTAYSPAGVSRRRLRRSVERIAYHGKNLLFGSHRVRYVARKSRTLQRRIRSRLWRMVYKFYRKISRPLPLVLQDVREAGYLANREYAPGPYPGKVTLFRATVRSLADSETADMGWRQLAQGGVEIRAVSGDHVDMLIRPQVAFLAGQLHECMDAALASPSREEGLRTPGS
ncbi:MAG: amino acid adenylation domain-containing protein [Acidobacteriota bacterium]